jgi:flagellar motor switch protein FliN/FliY
VKQLSPELLSLNEVPLYGYPPPFPWDQLSQSLGKLLEVKDLKIQAQEPSLRSSDELLSGLGGELFPLKIAIPPLKGFVYWILSKESINTLLTACLTGSPFPSAIVDGEFQEGFYRFIALESVEMISKLTPESPISAQIASTTDFPPEEAALAMDISIAIGSQTVWGRLVIPNEFRASWRERFAKRSLKFPDSLMQTLEVTVHLEGGKTTLNPSEWAEAKVGDFLLLDSCSLKDNHDSGRVMITLQGVPLFRAKVKDGNVKILESPLYHEVETSMAKQPPSDEEIEEHEEESFSDEEYGEITEEESIEGEGEEEEEEGTPQAPQAPKAAPTTPSQSLVKPEEIPMTVVVEVGRLQINIQKLTELQAGNLLELNVHPEDGVDLVVNGKCIAKGELLKVGETLGVRILEKA